jgi:DNA polymerase V
MPAQRIFALIDVNNCYVSCEQVFNPALNQRPVVVLSNNDGCVISRSPQAKALGIKMAVPIFQIQSLIQQHHVAVLSSNYALYAEMSRRFMNILASFVDPCEQEIYSIDECFLELTAYQQRYNLTAYAEQMLNTIKTWLGLPCCIGIGYSKTQAKMANHLAKTHPSFRGLCNLIDQDPCIIEDLLLHTGVAEVWGIGRKSQKALAAFEIHNVMDLVQANPRQLGRQFSVLLENTIRELNGIACIELDDAPSKRQQLVSSRSFGQPIREQQHLQEALTEFGLRAVQRLRQQQLLCKCIGVSVRYHRAEQCRGDPYTVVHLPDYSDDFLAINQAIQQGLARIFRAGHRYQKAGVMLLDLIPQQQHCPDLFADVQLRQQRAQLSAAWEHISLHYGPDTLRPARLFNQPQQPKWRMKQQYKSPSYLTRWDQLLAIN